MGTTKRRPHAIPWPPDPDAYRKCRACDRCRTGIGRDKNPDASDCRDVDLDATVRRSA
ncbi:hypothetical protein K353_02381 [Kitasatospora sp. SolWspMP-SS2h]|nr:hypothetical protein K353_02381 [Kitasatospora sp. SolWspMP-SS2h]